MLQFVFQFQPQINGTLLLVLIILVVLIDFRRNKKIDKVIETNNRILEEGANIVKQGNHSPSSTG